MESIHRTGSDMTSVRIVLVLAPLWLLALNLMRGIRSPTAGLCCYANKPRQAWPAPLCEEEKGWRNRFQRQSRCVWGPTRPVSSYSTVACHQVIQISIGIGKWNCSFSVFLFRCYFSWHQPAKLVCELWLRLRPRG